MTSAALPSKLSADPASCARSQAHRYDQQANVEDGRQRLGGRGYWGSRDGIATRTRVANAQSRSRLLHALAMREWEHGVRAGDPERRLRPLSGAVGSRRVAVGSRTRRGWHTIGGA